MNTIASAWKRITDWYTAHTPAGTLELAPGASDVEIADFEREVGIRLPDDLRNSFAAHNGTTNGGWLLHYGELLSLQQILYWHRQYNRWQKEENWGQGEKYKVGIAKPISAAIKPLWWNPSRLPLTDNSGNAVMVDFDPSDTGQFGQIIEFDHEIGPEQLLASSFGQWLNTLADSLENGEYKYHEDEETVAPVDMKW